ncbi:MAG TPA: glycosyltransferase family A protein [Ilumatobacteraceae bacterium]|nr:glycosyltransferase family A protein [Ilumatobacteraceae bacterium]
MTSLAQQQLAEHPRATPTVSVVMPTYNRARTIREALEPLLVDGEALEVIVVDDGSSDQTRAVLRTLADRAPVLRVISVENGGAARAREIGVKSARGEVVLILDDDVVASTGLVGRHARRHAGRSDLLVVGYMPTVRPAPASRATYATTIYADSYEEHCDEWERDPETILRRLWMGNVSLRTVDALRVGMSSAIVGYHADRDFGIRCAKAGISAVFDRSLLASHRYQRTLRSFCADARSQGATNFDVHAAHEDVLGPFDDHYHRGLGRISRAVITSVGFGPAYVGLSAATSAVVRLAGLIGAQSIEIRGARFLQRIEAQRGFVQRARKRNQLATEPGDQW